MGTGLEGLAHSFLSALTLGVFIYAILLEYWTAE